MDAETIYAVRVWVDPAASERLLVWLRHPHIADVVAQPGFLWARCIRLEQDAEDGWHAFMMLYGVESLSALDRYFENPIGKVFAEQRKAFEGQLRMDRAWGNMIIREDKRTTPQAAEPVHA